MPNLENDMDELFQRAAENYPLHPGKGDWDNIAKRITPKSEPHRVIAPVRSNRYKKFIVLLLLVVLSAGWLLLNDPKPGGNENALTNQTRNKNNLQEFKDSISDPSGKNKSFDPSKDNERNTSVKKIAIYQGKNSANVITGISEVFHYNIDSSYNNRPGNSYVIEQAVNADLNFPADRNFINPAKELIENLQDNMEEISVNNYREHKDTTGSELKDQFKNEDKYVIPKNTKKQTPAVPAKHKGIYFGLVAGLDFSKVLSASFNNTGTDAGVLLGFPVNSKFSVESGFIVNKKNYSSEGKNFSMNEVGSTMPPGMIINNLESQSSITEIPVKVKYDFLSTIRSAYFITVGVSAYIMTKEKNHYNVTVNGNQEKLTGIYEKNDFELPAVANISAGFEHKISRKLNIRVEPFLKIPLKGMGVGSLPLTSAGFHLGITREL